MDYVGLNHEPYEEVCNALAYRRNERFHYFKCENATGKNEHQKVNRKKENKINQNRIRIVQKKVRKNKLPKDASAESTQMSFFYIIISNEMQ